MRGIKSKISIFSKITILFCAVIFGLGIFSPKVIAQNTDTGWVINNFTSDITIEKDQHVKVSETIEADFGELQKHGIYRYIPYKYSRSGNTYNIRIKVESVKNDSGTNIPYEESRSGGNLELKIGDPDTTISGKQTYEIDYELDRVINHFSDHDEFYWNVTGIDWPVIIEKSSVQIIWPEDSEVTQNACYTGSYASNSQNCQYNISGVSENVVSFTANQEIYPSEGFTIVSGIKPGFLTPYTAWTTLRWFLSDNWAYFIPIIMLVYLLIIYHRHGKDPGGQTTIAPEFAVPDKLAPAELGTIYDEKVDSQDISAVIIDLAVRGFIKIKEIETRALFLKGKDYEFVSTGKEKTGIADYEKTILENLCDSGNKKLSDLKNSFYKEVKGIKDTLYNNVASDGYFAKNPEKVRGGYVGVGIVFLAIAFWGSFILVPIFGTISGNVAVGICGVLLLIFSSFMPKRTDKGVEITRRIKGFKLYMDTAEKYRQRFNEDQHIFERFLPYAMVFGITKKWAKAFEGLQVPKPDWYVGGGNFYPILFVANISSLQNSMNSTLISPSSAGSGGSGFSGGGVGGGFGGGGGGSW